MFKNHKNLRLNRTATKLKLAVLPLIALLLCTTVITAQSTVIDVASFDKVVVSPHIEVTFIEGDTESITIESITEPLEKLNVEVKNNTLSVYLEGAKMTTKTKKEKKNGYKRKVSIYNGRVVKATITYKNINTLDLRGEQRFVFESPIETKELRFNIYGESQVSVNEVDVHEMQVSIYGESYFEVKKGKARNQKITAYGETTVNLSEVKNDTTKLTAYGDGSFQLNVSEEIKITSYGEATIIYSGGGTLKKGLVIGETSISRTE